MSKAVLEQRIDKEQRNNDKLAVEIADLLAKTRGLGSSSGGFLEVLSLGGPLKERQRLKAESDDRLSALKRQKDALVEMPDKTGPITWLGTQRELGDWILEAHSAGKLKAKSRMDALKQTVEHFVGEDKKPLSARSIWQSLRNRDDYNNPRKRGPQ